MEGFLDLALGGIFGQPQNLVIVPLCKDELRDQQYMNCQQQHGLNGGHTAGFGTSMLEEKQLQREKQLDQPQNFINRQSAVSVNVFSERWLSFQKTTSDFGRNELKQRIALLTLKDHEQSCVH